ncbi:MAG: 5-(carboxyamino)imidazole ribonucleotide synthase [Nitrospirae bacterium]|nr:5-(carboxyamino)imidazole ribonucleotide synthase [Candidatus Manganitrophaceae bacterium]
MILSDQQIGILGGGQLGTFLTIAAKQMGYRVSVWDPDIGAPAHAWADHSIQTHFDHPESLKQFIQENAVITYEWENIPVSLVASIEAEKPVRPGSTVLNRLQNRIQEKGFLSEGGFPVTPYLPVLDPDQLVAAAESLGFPLICKTATAGYDGIGQWRLLNIEAVTDLRRKLKPRKRGWILEKVANFSKELSVIVARGVDGEVVTYPVSENIHENGILRLSKIPAEISADLSERIATLGKAVITALEGVGLFCIELFLLENDALLINEIAPRPHNSGHATMDSCDISQYAQQVRALCNLPLMPPRLLSPAVMLNVLGDEIKALRNESILKALLSLPGIHLYDYRKQDIKGRRKMGHITLTGSDPIQLSAQALQVQDLLKKS